MVGIDFGAFGELAKDAVEGLTVESYGTTADVYRPTVAGAGAYFGQYETGRTLVLSGVAMEVNPLTPRDLVEANVSRVASCSDDLDVRFDDVIVFDGINYRVTEVRRVDLFGTVTHKELHLEVVKEL